MAIDFYNSNLHPITMYKKEQKKQTTSYKGRVFLAKDDFNPDIHIYSIDAMKITGERAKNLKNKIIRDGAIVFVHLSKTVYLKTDIETI